MTAGRRALDKIYKRRDRYEISEWQRGEVWDTERKQQLIDSILRGWKLPKFYLLRLDDDDFEVVDGQQRLAAIYEFFSNELPLAEESVKEFGGPYYKDLKQRIADTFDDFEIEYDEIEESVEEELKQFFQRLQQGLPLTSSEKLNSVHSKLRDFCRSLVKHPSSRRKLPFPTHVSHISTLQAKWLHSKWRELILAYALRTLRRSSNPKGLSLLLQLLRKELRGHVTFWLTHSQ